MTQLTIKPYFKNLIPPLSPEELGQLEANILENGCRDTIKHWRGIIVDGHNRYAICQKHNLPYRIEKLPFGSKINAAIWIIENQLGRRNLTKATSIRLALEKATLEKERAKKTGQPFHLRKYASKLSGTSERLVQQYIRIVQHGDHDLLSQLERGELKIGTVYNGLRGGKKREYKATVYTKTVEPLCNSSSTPDISKSKNTAGAEYDIEVTGNMYRYIAEKSALINMGEDLDCIHGRLLAQLKFVEKML